MKICFVSKFLRGFRGGYVTSLELLAEALEKEHEVYFITTDKESDLTSRIISIPYSKFIPERLIDLGNTTVDKFLASGLKKLLCNNRPDLIHVQNPIIVPAVTSVSKKLDIPIVSTIRDNPQVPPEYAEELPLGVTWLWRRRFNTVLEHHKKVDAIISVSDYLRREFVNAGVPEDKITTIYNFPPAWKFTEKSETSSNVNLLALGRIRRFKGFEVLVKAVLLASKKVTNIRTIIAGSGQYFRGLKRLVKHLNLDEYIKVVSTVPYERVRELYFNSDIVLLLSTFPEPFSRVPLEAMAAGKPVIATNTGGTPEAIEHGVNGLLVPPNDPERAAEAIIKLAENKELGKTMGIAGRRILDEKFNPEKNINKVIRLYEEVVAKHCQK